MDLSVTDHIDPVAVVETLLQETLQKAFQNEAIRRHLGFAQVSQGSTADGFPLWYLWFSDRAGAFSLTVEEGRIYGARSGSDGGKTPRAVGARLAVRYFPDTEEAVFDSLSCLEQLCRLGPRFDATGTPSFEGAQSMDARFFVAGRIDAVVCALRTDVDFYCSAPNRWRECRAGGLTLTDEGGRAHQVVAPGEVDRDFPGWLLSFYLFDKLVSAFCAAFCLAPRCAAASTQPSVSYTIDDKQTVRAAADPNISETNVGVSFAGHGHAARTAAFAAAMPGKEQGAVDLWKAPDDMPPHLRQPHWWTIHRMHVHEDGGRLCACYQAES